MESLFVQESDNPYGLWYQYLSFSAILSLCKNTNYSWSRRRIKHNFLLLRKYSKLKRIFSKLGIKDADLNVLKLLSILNCSEEGRHERKF